MGARSWEVDQTICSLRWSMNAIGPWLDCQGDQGINVTVPMETVVLDIDGMGDLLGACQLSSVWKCLDRGGYRLMNRRECTKHSHETEMRMIETKVWEAVNSTRRDGAELPCNYVKELNPFSQKTGKPETTTQERRRDHFRLTFGR